MVKKLYDEVVKAINNSVYCYKCGIGYNTQEEILNRVRKIREDYITTITTLYVYNMMSEERVEYYIDKIYEKEISILKEI